MTVHDDDGAKSAVDGSKVVSLVIGQCLHWVKVTAVMTTLLVLCRGSRGGEEQRNKEESFVQYPNLLL